MAKTPAIPAGISRDEAKRIALESGLTYGSGPRKLAESFTDDLEHIGDDVGRVVPTTPQVAAASLEQRFKPGCGEVGHEAAEAAPMPERDANRARVRARFHGAYLAMGTVAAPPFSDVCLVIVPARNEWEAETGSGILAVGSTGDQAWKRAAELCN